MCKDRGVGVGPTYQLLCYSGQFFSLFEPSFRFVFILICKMDETILKESVSSLVFVDE